RSSERARPIEPAMVCRAATAARKAPVGADVAARMPDCNDVHGPWVRLARNAFLISRARTARGVAGPKPWLEAKAFVKPVHAGVLAATLQKDMMTVLGPRCGERSADNGLSMASPPKCGAGDDIFDEAMPPSRPQKIRCRIERAAGNDFDVLEGHKDRDA